jgi:hypothetical protein
MRTCHTIALRDAVTWAQYMASYTDCVLNTILIHANEAVPLLYTYRAMCKEAVPRYIYRLYTQSPYLRYTYRLYAKRQYLRHIDTHRLYTKRPYLATYRLYTKRPYSRPYLCNICKDSAISIGYMQGGSTFAISIGYMQGVGTLLQIYRLYNKRGSTLLSIGHIQAT